MNATLDVVYNVVCSECGQIFQPRTRSPLWWKAKQATDSGRLDAISISGEECGCIRKQYLPNAPFRVFGYNDMCEDFDVPCATFVEAVNLYRRLNKEGCVVFINGVSDIVEDKLKYPW